MNIAEAKKKDLVNYLESLGFTPKKITNNDYWYVSPLRDEKTPSFKIDRNKNLWYDHGLGQGGTIIEFGTLYFRCTVKEFLQKLSSGTITTDFSFQPQKKNSLIGSNKIEILSSTEITDPSLRNYLHNRCIPLVIANQFCSQVAFELKNKKHLAIGFQNAGGGYELRNHYFKGSSSPKEPKLIEQKDAVDLAVFEGFFSFLSFQTFLQSKNNTIIELPDLHTNYFILNSVAFFEKSRELMERYNEVHLFLDNDKMGKHCTEKALQWSAKFKDQSYRYKIFKDLNQYLVKLNRPELKLRQNRGRTL